MRSVTEGNALTLILVLPARYLAHLARAAWHKTLHIQHSCVFSLLDRCRRAPLFQLVDGTSVLVYLFHLVEGSLCIQLSHW